MDFAGTVSKQGRKSHVASMSTFSGLVVRGKIIVAAMATFSAAQVRLISRSLASSMATLSAAIMRGRLLVADTATMAGSIAKFTVKSVFAAGMAAFDVTWVSNKARVLAFTASMATMSGNLARTIGKFFTGA